MTRHGSQIVVPTAGASLPGLPRRAMSHEEQLEALRRVQAQADERVQLGLKLFEAAQTRTAYNQKQIEQFKAEQDTLRQQLHDDVASSLRDYDQWIGQIDDKLARRVDELEDRLRTVALEWCGAQERIDGMLARADALLEQSRHMLEAVEHAVARTCAHQSRTVEQTVSIAPPDVDDEMVDVDDELVDASDELIDEDDDAIEGDGEQPPEPSPIYTRLIERLRGRASDHDAA